jgi:hypothetical protein
MQLLFFLGYTILAALHHVACFLLVGVGGYISGKQSQIGPRKITASTGFARERKSAFWSLL